MESAYESTWCVDDGSQRYADFMVLCMACEEGDARTAELILERGLADPRLRHADGSTAMHAAALGGEDCVRLLLKYGLPPDPVDRHGKTPMDWAMGVGDDDAADALARAAGWLGAKTACIEGDAVALGSLLRDGRVNVSLVDAEGDTLLHHAAEGGSTECASALLAAGASVDGPEQGVDTPLLRALAVGNLPVALFLLERGANPAARNSAGAGADELIGMSGGDIKTPSIGNIARSLAASRL